MSFVIIMECLYYASSLKPTAINGASVGSFTGPRDRNLVVAKNNRIEVSHVTENGVEPFFDLELFGRIACMQTIRLSVSHPSRVMRAIYNDISGWCRI